jgi:hypothetical protein
VVSQHAAFIVYIASDLVVMMSARHYNIYISKAPVKAEGIVGIVHLASKFGPNF